MQKVAIVTDCASGIPKEIANELGIVRIPLQVVMDGKAYTSGRDISPEEVYSAMKGGKVLKTTQPLVPDIKEGYEEALSKADRVLSVHIGSRLTSTVQTCRMVAESLAPDRIRVVDSSTLTMMYGLACIKAARKAVLGCTLEEAASIVEDTLSRIKGWLAVPSLKHLAQSGRVSKVLSGLSTLLSVKVILRMEGGEVQLEDRYRSSSLAFGKLRDLAVESCKGRAEALVFVHGDDPANARELEELVMQSVDCDDIFRADLGPVVGIHTGPDPFGVAVLP